MTSLLNSIKHNSRLLLMGLGAALAIALTSTAVFAAIPNSATGDYEACRLTLTGAVRIIDTQASQSCTIGEAAMSWPSTASMPAYAMINTSGELDSGFTTDAVQDVTVTETGNGDYHVCFELDFAPKFGRTNSGSNSNDVYVRGGGTNEQGMINANCGSGYEAYSLQPSISDDFKYMFFQ